jgi:hypothetical protein
MIVDWEKIGSEWSSAAYVAAARLGLLAGTDTTGRLRLKSGAVESRKVRKLRLERRR